MFESFRWSGSMWSCSRMSSTPFWSFPSFAFCLFWHFLSDSTLYWLNRFGIEKHPTSNPLTLTFQENFGTFGLSTIKTTVMLIGEFEYDDIFFDNPRDQPTPKLPYRTVTLLFFVCFIMIMSIIVMNLLVCFSCTITDSGLLPCFISKLGRSGRRRHQACPRQCSAPKTGHAGHLEFGRGKVAARLYPKTIHRSTRDNPSQ